MAQTALTPVYLKLNNYAVVAGDLAIVPVAMDASNGNSFQASGSEILFFQNSDSSPHTITITSVADPYGRTDASLTAYSIASSGFAFIEMKQLQGWLETGALVYLATSSALVKVAVLRTT
jgi:hypothetical protein